MKFAVDEKVDLDEGGWNDSPQNLTKEIPLWREDPSISFSDWKIVVQNDEHMSFVYHTHKCFLALGARRSQYFATQFRLPYQPVEETRSEILMLPTLCILCFSTFLDFVYGGALRVHKNNVVPLMELARRLGNVALGKQTEAWVRNNLGTNNGNCAL
eukprot:3305797-Ditylum_brightwellii.AAC.1